MDRGATFLDQPGWSTIKGTIERWLRDDRLQESSGAHPALKPLVENGFEVDRENTIWDEERNTLNALIFTSLPEQCDGGAQTDAEEGLQVS